MKPVVWEAPAKLNLSLELRAPDSTGYHPLRSLTQTIERLDLLTVGTGEDERLEVAGADIGADEDNLVWRAVRALVGRPDRPRLHMHLQKAIPPAAGLGGGSSDAAAVLRAAARIYRRSDAEVELAAGSVGADVPFFLVGGTRWMEGYGEVLREVELLEGFCVGVAVPPIEVSTPTAYRRWDELEGPVGPEMADSALPPALRRYGPLRNDLTPAARSLEPELGDWAAELAVEWGRPVAMTGSGSAHFAFFLDLDEAVAAATAVSSARLAFAAGLRDRGVVAR
jgi:4-diphosphocytidyl-2-C-methyl-D-erythritol kinase